jgi:Protein of unknown function (DUF1566)
MNYAPHKTEQEEMTMRTRRRGLACVLALVTVVSVLVLKLPAVSGRSQILPGVPAAWPPWQNPDPPCFDNTTRYAICGNGTVTDMATGLIWLQDAGCLGSLNWAEANQAAAVLEHGQCGLTDQSKPGDWRLPSNAEWVATVDAAKNHALLQCTNPALTADNCSTCFGSGSGSSFSNVVSAGYWSSTTNSQSSALLPDGTKAGVMDLSSGFLLSLFDKSCCPQRVWPVRVR